jgi:nucleotide-binding universal stress UspA family protein
MILTHVSTPGRFAGPAPDTRTEAEPYLTMQARQLEAQGLEVVLETPTGLPGRSLNLVAQKHDASLVVLGTHGKSLWREGVLGSFSSAVLHQASYPILLLPVRVSADRAAPGCLWRCAELLRHLLVPTDFSEIAAEALIILELLAPRGVARVTLLHALEVQMSEIFSSSLHVTPDAPEYNSLEILKNRLEAAGVPRVQAQVTPGHPVAVILAALQSLDISLIVMGTQGRGFIEEIFLGSVAHNISRVAAYPLLLVPWMKR